MNTREKVGLIFFGLLFASAIAVSFFGPKKNVGEFSPPPPPIVEPPPPPLGEPYADEIEIAEPVPGSIVSSPLRVRGRVRGFWFFEANLPISILDGDGNVVAITPFQARGEWMTEDFVEFDGEISFSPPASDTGYLLVANDNPSGLPEFAKSIRIPIRFRAEGE